MPLFNLKFVKFLVSFKNLRNDLRNEVIKMKFYIYKYATQFNVYFKGMLNICVNDLLYNKRIILEQT